MSVQPKRTRHDCTDKIVSVVPSATEVNHRLRRVDNPGEGVIGPELQIRITRQFVIDKIGRVAVLNNYAVSGDASIGNVDVKSQAGVGFYGYRVLAGEVKVARDINACVSTNEDLSTQIG